MKRIFAALCGSVIAVSAVSCGKNGAKTSIEAFKDMGQVIWDNDAVTVTFESYDDSVPLEPVINLKAYNKTDSERHILLSDFYVNDFALTVSAFLDEGNVPPGETVDTAVKIYSGAVENSGIEEIGKITLGFVTGNPNATSREDTFLNSDEIDIFTDNKDWEKNQEIPDGELLYDEDGMRISAVLSNDFFMYGYTLPLYIENNSENFVTVELSSMRFGGAEGALSIPHAASLSGGKKVFKYMAVYSAYEAAGITAYDVFSPDSDEDRPEKTEVKFTITKYDGKGGENSIETDYIEIKGLSQKEE